MFHLTAGYGRLNPAHAYSCNIILGGAACQPAFSGCTPLPQSLLPIAYFTMPLSYPPFCSVFSLLRYCLPKSICHVRLNTTILPLLAVQCVWW